MKSIDLTEYRKILLKQKETIKESLFYTIENNEVSELIFLLKCVNLQLEKINALVN
jgi:hypothetical protein